MGQGSQMVTKTVAGQGALSLGPDTFIRTERKDWNKREMKQFTFECWFKTSQDKGIILSTSDENLLLLFKNGRYCCLLNQQKYSPDVDVPIETGKWNHLAIVLDTQNSSIHLYHNGARIMKKSEISIGLKSMGRNYLLIFAQLSGSVTEVRLWKIAKSEEQVKANLRTPLSIVPLGSF
jgi:hypothetical protein